MMGRWEGRALELGGVGSGFGASGGCGWWVVDGRAGGGE